MIEGDTDIEKYRRDDHSENERYSNNLSQIHPCERKSPARELQGFVSFLDLIEKDDLTSLECEAIFFCESIIFVSEIIIKGFDFFEDIFDSGFHREGLYS